MKKLSVVELAKRIVLAKRMDSINEEIEWSYQDGEPPEDIEQLKKEYEEIIDVLYPQGAPITRILKKH